MTSKHPVTLWSPQGQEDLRQALEAAGPGSLAERLLKGADAAVGLIHAFPGLGRPGSLKGTREHLFADLPFLLVYEFDGTVLYILRFYHTSRQWPPVRPSKKKA